MFIAIEGIDGSGKSSIARKLAKSVRAGGREVVLCREPGGTPIGEKIRVVLLDGSADAMIPETEALLFAAARAQLVGEVIRPALSRDAVVIADRFSDSSLAYQWGGRGLPRGAVSDLQRFATAGIEPDLKLLLDLPVETALARRFADADAVNRLDSETVQFHSRVREAYHSLVAADPARWRLIDATRSPHDVWSAVWQMVTDTGELAHSGDPDIVAPDETERV